ncbi:MAG: transcriptional regulator [Actinobacteria bacterium]|nr:MAG: transcriptional regulator [Actinomycetota bacterium]
MSNSPRRSHKSPLRKTWIILAATVLILLLVVASALAYIRYSIDSQIRHIPISLSDSSMSGSDSPGDGSQPVPISTATNILILGSDSRSSGGDPTDWRIGAQRSDVMMVLQLSKDTNSMTIMSIPRDSWVNVPGYGMQKINAAYSLGGAELAIDTVENLMGINLDHFAVVDFESFSQITDQLGGVTIKTVEGEQHFDGAGALSFVRERKSLPGGDFDRVRRQQAWMRAIMTRIFEKDTLKNPAQLNSLVEILFAHSAMDEGLTFDSMMDLAFQARGLHPSNVTMLTAPVKGTDTSSDGQSIVLLDKKLMTKLGQAWSNDALSEFINSSSSLKTLKSAPIR